MYNREEQECINQENNRPFHSLGKGVGMNHPFIEEVKATGEEIQAIIEAVTPILGKVPVAHACMACLAIALTAMNPNLTQQELQTGVKGASEWVCQYVTGIEMGSMPLGKMN